MSVNASIIRWDLRRSVGFATLAGLTWEAVGTPFTKQVRIIKITNTTDADIDLSTVGIDGQEMDIYPHMSQGVYDLTANKSDQGGYAVFPEGTQIYVKAQTAPTKGSLYVVCIYASEF